MAHSTAIASLLERNVVPRIGAPFTTGKVIYVNSNAADPASDAEGFGYAKDTPCLTLDYALSLCTANEGDVIVLMPGHAETLTAVQSLDVAGVHILGLGWGASRPTFTLGADAHGLAFDAASIVLENVLVSSVTAAVTKFGLDVNAADCLIDRVEIRTSGSGALSDLINLAGTAQDCARTRIRGCKLFDSTGCAGGVVIDTIHDGIVIEDCTMILNAGDACISSGVAFTNAVIARNLLYNTQAGDHAIELTAAATGLIVDNRYGSSITQATACDPGSMFNVQNFHVDAIDVSGILSPLAT